MREKCLFEVECVGIPLARNLCRKHYLKVRKLGQLDNYPFPEKQTKLCTEKECNNKHYGKGLCHYHYKQLPDVKEQIKKIEEKRKDNPVRKKQKAEAQDKYSRTVKGSYSILVRQAKKKKKDLTITQEEYLNLKRLPCHKCSGPLEERGLCLILINKRRFFSLDNVLPTCKICQLLKPKEDFNPISFAKIQLRRHWKRTPMAGIALQKAKRGNKYECNLCKQLFKEKEINLDHINPVINVEEGYIDLDTYVKNLYCDDSNLQVLCKADHSDKTKKENKARKK